MNIEFTGDVEGFFKDHPEIDKLLIIELDENDRGPEMLPIMCGECWLNTGTPVCKCLTNNPK